jgi:hypothetical protein
MNFSELVHLYFERSNSLQGYWTVYVIIVGGLLAFSSLRKAPDPVTTVLISVLFAFFAYKNLGAIEDVSLQRFAVLEAISRVEQGEPAQTGELRKLFGPTLNPPGIDGVRKFHLASDLLTIAALWAMELRRKKGSPALV